MCVFLRFNKFFTFIQLNYKIFIRICQFFLVILHFLIRNEKRYYQTHVYKPPNIALHESVSLIGDAADARIGFAYDRADYLYLQKVKRQVHAPFADGLHLRLPTSRQRWMVS